MKQKTGDNKMNKKFSSPPSEINFEAARLCRDICRLPMPQYQNSGLTKLPIYFGTCVTLFWGKEADIQNGLQSLPCLALKYLPIHLERLPVFIELIASVGLTPKRRFN